MKGNCWCWGTCILGIFVWINRIKYNIMPGLHSQVSQFMIFRLEQISYGRRLYAMWWINTSPDKTNHFDRETKMKLMQCWRRNYWLGVEWTRKKNTKLMDSQFEKKCMHKMIFTSVIVIAFIIERFMLNSRFDGYWKIMYLL